MKRGERVCKSFTQGHAIAGDVAPNSRRSSRLSVFVSDRMQPTSTTVVTTTTREPEEPAQQEQLVLRLRPPASPPHVTWAEGTVGL